ncbi:MAG: glycosyltransferase [Thermoanaerobaculales bacterium]|nr:glycosyltransferase [Thermoanaerobaculales bacterium]
MSTKKPAVSVVVCTRNRSAALAGALEALLAVDFDPAAWELVVIDNASTDDTPEVAARVVEANPGRARLVVEPEIGLSAARNAGIAAAAAPIVAFLDDDAFPEAGWLTAIVDGFDRPEVMCVGGPVAPLIEGELPDWFRGRFLPYLTVWDLGAEPVELVYNEYPRGANVAYRRSGLDGVGGFSPHLGRKGASLLSCEEIELCLRLERAGFATLYQPGARVSHLTPVGRLTPQWLAARFAAQGRSEAIVNWMHAGWRGLRAGLRTARRHAAEVRRNRAQVGGVFADCHRHTVRGYRRGFLDALRVPRYRPADPGVAVAPWMPFE